MQLQNVFLIGSILTIHILAWLTPGPLFVLIIRNSLVYSRKTGIWTACGIALGNMTHILYSVTGISLLIQNSVSAFTLIKFLGVIYLSYLGIKTFFLKIETPNERVHEKKHDISPISAVRIGFLTNVLNPNASLFFASIFAGVFASGAPLWVVGFLMIAMPCNSFLMASLFSLFFTQKKVQLFYVKFDQVINKLLGVILIILAAIIVLRK